MKNKINFLANHFKIPFIKNIFSLGLLQSANYIIPLLTIPYLVRVLGPDYFGLLAFATATIMYLVLFSDYGFNLSATKQISLNRENKKRVSEIFSSVLIVKFTLMIFSFLILLLIVFFIDRFNSHWEIYILTFGMVVGQVLFPVWLFQGTEKMQYITYINIFSKSIFTALIFIFVNSRSDLYFVPIFTSLGAIFSGLYSMHIAINKMGYKLYWPGINEIKFQLNDGWHVFFSSMAISFYTVSTTFILGILTNNALVGQFSAVDKIIQAVKGIYQPISQAVYPMVGKLFQENKFLALIFITKLTKFVIFFMLFLSSILYLFADTIVYIILGNQFSDASTLLKIMSPLPLIIALSNILGVQIMLNIGMKSVFSKILAATAILGIVSSLILVPILNDQGTAYSLLISEIFVTSAMYLYLKRSGFNFKVQQVDVNSHRN